MRLWKGRAAAPGEPGPRFRKEVHAPDAVFTPGSMPVKKTQWWADPQALRKAAEGGVLLAFALIFGVYGTSLYFKSTESARRKSCRDNLHAVSMALTMYAQDYDGIYPPPDADIGRCMFKAVGLESRYLICPSDDLARPNPRNRRDRRIPISYTYRAPASGNPDASPGNQPLLWDRNGGVPIGAHRQGGNILFVDGHVRWVHVDYWKASDVPW